MVPLRFTTILKNRVDVQELEHEQELRHFLKGNPEIDILEQYKKTYSYQGNNCHKKMFACI